MLRELLRFGSEERASCFGQSRPLEKRRRNCIGSLQNSRIHEHLIDDLQNLSFILPTQEDPTPIFSHKHRSYDELSIIHQPRGHLPN
jgi:hypothetical protein